MIKCKICSTSMAIWYGELIDDRHGHPNSYDVYKCPECGFAQTSPQISPAKISKLYEDYYPRRNINVSKLKISDFRVGTKYYRWRKGLQTNCHYNIPEDKSLDILDIGSGVGYSLLEIKNMGNNPYGLDPDRNGKKVAHKYHIPFHYGFIEDKPFAGKKFDYVIASQVLEHTNSPIRFLKICKSRIKPGGSIILSFPNPNSVTRQLLGDKWLHWHIPYHLNHFSKKSIYLLAKKTGVTVEKIETVTPNMWTNLQIRRLFQNIKPGERDEFWDNGKSTISTGNTGIASVVNQYLPKINYFLENYNYLNRFIDVLGGGESFVVTFSTSERTH